MIRHVAIAGATGVAVLALAACGGSSPRRATVVVRTAPATTPATTSTTASTPAPPPAPKPPPPAYPQLLSVALGSGATPFVPAVRWRGQTAIWISRSASVSLMAFNQGVAQLRLHSGTQDAGVSGWRYGPSVGGAELGRLAAAFNGGFKFSAGAGGFEAYGHVGAPVRDGLASIVTYADGTTDIGSWHQEVPAPGKQVVSVRQNLSLLIDHGRPAFNLGCLSCWGDTLGGVVDPARSALGITAAGTLIWVGGENLTVSGLVDALRSARVVRAAELDINPMWVAGYLYGHRGGVGPLAPVPVLAAQHGIPGQYLAPWSRDFFAVVVR